MTVQDSENLGGNGPEGQNPEGQDQGQNAPVDDDQNAADDHDEGHDNDAGNADLDYSLELPEGSTLSEDHLNQLTEKAKEAGLNSEQAGDFLAFQESVISDLQKQAIDDWGAQVDAWEQEVKSDPELGGDKWPATDQNIKAALDAFGSESLKTALNETGYGNHPDLIRFINKVGQSLGEDSPVGGNSNSAGGEVTLAQALYGNQAN